MASTYWTNSLHLSKQRFEEQNIAFAQAKSAPSPIQCKVAHVRTRYGYKLLPLPPYSPALAPRGYIHFQNLKLWLCKRVLAPSELVPKKAKVGQSAKNIMATVFWDDRGIVHIDYLQTRRTINSKYKANLLDRFNDIGRRSDRIRPKGRLGIAKQLD